MWEEEKGGLEQMVDGWNGFLTVAREGKKGRKGELGTQEGGAAGEARRATQPRERRRNRTGWADNANAIRVGGQPPLGALAALLAGQTGRRRQHRRQNSRPQGWGRAS